MARRSNVAAQDPDKSYGKPFEYDPGFKGPRDRRGCTDIIFLILFIVFLVAWIGLGFYAFARGDPARILHPTDFSGRQCGVHAEVRDKPYLLFFDPSLCARTNVLVDGCSSPSVCVQQCPEEELYAPNYYNAKSLNGVPVICLPNVHPLTGSELRAYVEQHKCAKWFMRSIPGSVGVGTKICVPNLAAIADPDQVLEVQGQKVHGIAIKEVLRGSSIIQSGRETGEQVVSDVQASYPFIVGGLVGAMVVSFLYIVLLRWLTAPMVWGSILMVFALLAVGIYECYTFWDQQKQNKNVERPWDSVPPELATFLDDPNTWLTFLIALSVVLAILVLIVLFLRKRIRLATALIAQAGRAVSDTTSTLFFPIVPWALQVAVLAFTVSVVLYLATCGEATYKVTGLSTTIPTCICQDLAFPYKDGDNCTPTEFNSHCANCVQAVKAACNFERYSPPDYMKWLQLFNIFGALWTLFFISGMAHMILAATFASWYWTFHKSDAPFFILTRSFFMCITYHTGTVAFGSLIIAIVRLIRLILDYIEKKASKYGDSGVAKCVMCFCKCCFACIEGFLKFISKNAYIMCAIHGKNFCASAKDAFNLLMRNVLRVVVLDKIMDFTFFIGKLLITAVVCTAMHFILKQWPQNLNYNAVPITITGVGAFLISSIFFGVYSVAVETLFLCFLEDCERNDGSAERPYFMSGDLRKLFGKKNRSKAD